MDGNVSESGGEVKLTAAALANSFSGSAAGDSEVGTLQENDGSEVHSDLTGSLSNVDGDVSLTGAGLGNSMRLGLSGHNLTLHATPNQRNNAGVSSNVVSTVGAAGNVNATAAAIGNTISISNKVPGIQ